MNRRTNGETTSSEPDLARATLKRRTGPGLRAPARLVVLGGAPAQYQWWDCQKAQAFSAVP
jgi:hypothetical protein